MKKILYTLLILVCVIFVTWWFTKITVVTTQEEPVVEEPTPQQPTTTYNDLITVTSPTQYSQVTSPLTITGEARGTWFFEASFPVILVNWDGLIIAQGIATAQGDWMTEDFVSFTAELTFTSPYTQGDPDFMQKGALILKKDNPSGMPQYDDALEMPVVFAPQS